MTNITNSIATIELSVLETLSVCSAGRPLDCPDYLYTWKIAEGADLPAAYARCALISLRNKGLVIYARGLFDDDGKTAGSGYAITVRGEQHLAAEQGPLWQGRDQPEEAK